LQSLISEMSSHSSSTSSSSSFTSACDPADSEDYDFMFNIKSNFEKRRTATVTCTSISDKRGLFIQMYPESNYIRIEFWTRSPRGYCSKHIYFSLDGHKVRISSRTLLTTSTSELITFWKIYKEIPPKMRCLFYEGVEEILGFEVDLERTLLKN